MFKVFKRCPRGVQEGQPFLDTFCKNMDTFCKNMKVLKDKKQKMSKNGCPHWTPIGHPLDMCAFERSEKGMIFKMELRENERIDDLQYKGLKIIQNTKTFCFGIDAVLLANFASEMKRKDVVVDLCTGNGVIAILVAGKTSAKKIIGVEIQKEVAEMATRSINLNDLQDRVEIINEDLNNLKDKIGAGSVDTVTVNPPYKRKGSGIINDENALTIARHEIYCTLEDVIKEASRILKTNGSFYMVHRPERLVDIFCLMRENKIEPKRIRFVHPSQEKPANLVLIEGTKDGKSFLKFENSLYVYKDGKYTQDIYKIYEMEK